MYYISWLCSNLDLVSSSVISHVFMHFYNEVLDLSYSACICRINLFNIEYELLLHTISYVIIKWGYFLLQNEQFLFTLNKRNSDKCIITLIYSITCIKFILYSSYIYTLLHHLCKFVLPFMWWDMFRYAFLFCNVTKFISDDFQSEATVLFIIFILC